MRISDWSSDVCSSDLVERSAALPVEDRCLLVHHRPALTEAGTQGLLEILILRVVDLAHREEHDEQGHQHGDHVGVGDEPPFVVLVLLLDHPRLACHLTPPRRRRRAATSARSEEHTSELKYKTRTT